MAASIWRRVLYPHSPFGLMARKFSHFTHLQSLPFSSLFFCPVAGQRKGARPRPPRIFAGHKRRAFAPRKSGL